MVTSGKPSKELVVHDTSQQKESHRSTSSVHSYREGTSPVIPQKPSEDGYSWRKYGQKNVKGNEFIRSYYKCSYYDCQVKKQVERAHDGRITDTTYFGNHEHPKSLSNLQPALPSLLSAQVQIPDLTSTVAEDKSFDPHDPNTDVTKAKDCHELAIVQVNDDSTQAVSSTRASNIDNRIKKRRKKGINIVEARLEKPSDESRLVVETVCAVDIVNDGYRWRKYGQKLVKGNPNPRSYYRCSHSGCPAKKHVERASRDPKVVITTYEGQHDHDLPPTRAIVPHRPLTSGTSPLDGVNKSKSEEIKAERNGSSTHKRPRNDSSKRKRPEEGCFSDDGEKKEEKDEAMAVSQTRTLDNEREVPTVFSQLTTVKKGEKEVYADFETVNQANSAKKACVNKSMSEETEAERNGSSKHERLEEGNLNDDGEKDESMFVAQIRTLEEQLKVPTVVTQETTVKKEVKEVYVDFETVDQVNSIKEEEKTTMSGDVVTGVSAVKKDGGDTKLEADSVGQNPADQSASGEQQKPDTVITPSRSKSKEDEQRIPDVKLNSSCPDIKQPKADAETVNC